MLLKKREQKNSLHSFSYFNIINYVDGRESVMGSDKYWPFIITKSGSLLPLSKI